MFSQVRSSAVFWPGRLWSTACRAVWVFYFGPNRLLWRRNTSKWHYFRLLLCLIYIYFFLWKLPRLPSLSFLACCQSPSGFILSPPPPPHVLRLLTWQRHRRRSQCHSHFEYIITTSLLGTSILYITLLRVARSIPLQGRTPFFQGGVSYRLVYLWCDHSSNHQAKLDTFCWPVNIYLNIYSTHTFKDFNKAKVFLAV